VRVAVENRGSSLVKIGLEGAKKPKKQGFRGARRECVRLVNKTRGKVVAENVIERVRFLEVITGLIPYKRDGKYVYDWMKKKFFREDNAMLFRVSGKVSIHTFFMSFPIVVVFLDKKMRVVEKCVLKPFRSYASNRECECFIELVRDKSEEINIGDELLLDKKIFTSR
jgi:uncharacterized membrane protein (UPF0127 family)